MAEVEDPGEPLPHNPIPDPYAHYARKTVTIVSIKPDYNIRSTGVLTQRVAELKTKMIDGILKI